MSYGDAEKDDGRRFDVRWWDERLGRWGTAGTSLPLKVAEGQRGILLALHRTVELRQVDTKPRSKR